MDRIIYLVRHTRTSIEDGVCYGQTDADVSESFNADSNAIRNKLVEIIFDRIYSSPLKRCTRLASVLGKDIVTDHRLMEMNFGHWEEKKWDDIFITAEGEKWFSDYLKTPCPGGESFFHLQQRVADFMASFNSKEKNILIVAHAGIIRAVLVYLGLIPVEKVFETSIKFGEIIKLKNNEYQVI